MRIHLPEHWIQLSLAFGEIVAWGYRVGAKAVSITMDVHGIALDPLAQALGRMHECCVCLALGLDPGVELNWTRRCDLGTDLRYRGLRLDVKGTEHGWLLIWPLSKNHVLPDANFDVLVMVRGGPPDFDIVGWITRRRFLDEHRVAGQGHRLKKGTWYVERGLLQSLSELGA